VDPEPAYITKQHASIVYDLKTRSLEDAVRKGFVRAFRIGRKVLIEKVSIEEWIQSHEIAPIDHQATKSELQTLLSRAIEHARKAGA
jgi:hypothetical protein